MPPTWLKPLVTPLSVATALASESSSSLPRNSAWPGTDWKLRAKWEERELERSQISQKDFGWRNAGAVKNLHIFLQARPPKPQVNWPEDRK